MASSLNTINRFKTTTMATVYQILPGATKATPMGFLYSGKVVQFQDLTTLNGIQYGSMNNYGGASFTVNGSGEQRSTYGYWLSALQVVATDENAASSNTYIDKDGKTNYVNNIEVLASRQSYYVKQGHTIYPLNGPGGNYVGNTGRVFDAGDKISIYATCVDTDTGRLWGATSSSLNVWVWLEESNGTLNAALSRSDTSVSNGGGTAATGRLTPNVNAYGNITDATDETYISVQDALKEMQNMNVRSSDGSDLEALNKMQYVIGIPPQITRTADIPYLTGASPSNPFGRCYTEMFMMGNTVFSIQPCKVKYLPGMRDDDKASFFDYIADSIRDVADDAILKGEDGSVDLSGQLFEAQPDYNAYINTVNILARAIAIYLGIGDHTYMNTNHKFKYMDYSFYKREQYAKNGDIFSVIADTVRAIPDRIVTSVINDDTYVHFYMTADGTSVNEDLTVSTKSTGLESLFNTQFSELAQEIQFLGGGGQGAAQTFDSIVNDVANGIADTGAGMGNMIGNIVKYGGNYLKGGRLVFPQMLDDCTYSRSYSGTCRFISPSGDPEAIFLNCFLPLCYLLPYVLPQMLSDNMYTYPFLARVNAKGLYHCDLAAITNLRIQRGGQDGTQWTADGLPFEIDVSFDITPLYSKLMVASARHPILFLSNTSLHEYLGAMTGVSFTGDSIKLKLATVQALLGSYLADTIPSMLRGYYSSDLANWLRKLVTFR